MAVREEARGLLLPTAIFPRWVGDRSMLAVVMPVYCKAGFCPKRTFKRLLHFRSRERGLSVILAVLKSIATLAMSTGARESPRRHRLR